MKFIWFYFLRRFLLLFALFFACMHARGGQAKTSNWNILLIQSDQHNIHMIGADRQVLKADGTHNTMAQTPHIDQLAKEGIYFNKAYDAFPVCAPTRQSLLTGQYPQVHGMFDNSDKLWHFTEGGPNGRTPSFAHYFRSVGYNTALLGKSHTNNYLNEGDTNSTQWLGFDYRVDVQPWDGSFSYQRQRYLEVKERYKKLPHSNGGRPVSMLDWEQTIEDEGKDIGRVNSSYTHTALFDARTASHPAYFRDGVIGYDTLSYLDAYANARDDTDKATEYKVNPDKPLFCFVNFIQPHWPYASPPMQDGEIFFHRYIGHLTLDEWGTVPVDMPSDVLGLLEWEMKSPYVEGDSKRSRLNGQNFLDRHIRWGRAKYYGSISWVDHMIGSIVDQLDQLDDPRYSDGTKLSETTIVAYTSDHGDMMGEKQLWGKYLMYEGSARVPFIVRMPGAIKPGQYSDILINHVDMIPTLAGLAGCAEGMDDDVYGKNYAEAVLANDPMLGPERIFSVVQITASNQHPRNVMSRTQQYKFIRHKDPGPDGYHYPVLFDMDNDPLETENLAYYPEYKHIVNEENRAIDQFLAQFGVPKLNINMSTTGASPAQLKITSPIEGATLEQGAGEVAFVEASNGEGIDSILLYVDNKLFANHELSPYLFSISSLESGPHLLQAKMIEQNTGKILLSNKVNVRVQGGAE